MTLAEKLTLIAQNEQKVYNAGYEKGKNEGGGGSGGEKPTLFTPSIKINSVTSELTITDDRNGDFEIFYDIYANNEFITTLTSKTATLNEYIEHTETIQIKVQATSINFNPSDYAIAEWKYVNVSGTPGLAYSLSSDGTYATCTGIGDAVITDIEISSLYEGVPVTQVRGFSKTSVTSVIIPDSVTSIGDYAFQNCSSLTSVTIGDSVTSIGDYAFQNCSKLTSVTIGNSVTTIGDYAFRDCTSLTSVTIPDSITRIGPQAFRNCTSLASVTIPDSVTSIGSSAFDNCSSLTSVTIPDSVTSIGSSAFDNCSSLTSVTIGDSVTSIGSSAFYNCSSLKRVDCSKCTSIPTISSNSFDNTYSTLQIKVPANLIDSWKSATNWANYADKIVTEFTNEV